MGLDVAFNRKQALDAGMKVVNMPNADEDYIAEAVQIYDDSSDPSDIRYLNYLKSEGEYLKIEGCDHFVENQGSSNSENFIVRANRWGNTYAPLTAWLLSKNIQWSEF